jgi:hypothetical protein
MERSITLIKLVLVCLAFSTTANATLILNDHNLVYDNDLNITWNQPDAFRDDAGFTGWRRPSLDEMSHLYFSEFGGQIGSTPNFGPFPNLRGAPYWSSDALPGNSQVVSFTFNFNNGTINSYYNSYGNAFSIFVHDGNIAPFVENTPVPEPTTLILFGLGFGGFAYWRRKSLN